MNNKNEDLSRNRTKRVEGKCKLNGKTKFSLSKTESETKKKNKKFNKTKQLEFELLKIKYATNPNKLKPELEELN